MVRFVPSQMSAYPVFSNETPVVGASDAQIGDVKLALSRGRAVERFDRSPQKVQPARSLSIVPRTRTMRSQLRGSR